jgi:hypothetical protein
MVLVEVEVVGRFLSKSEVLEKSSFGFLVVLSSRLFVMKEGWF